MSEFVGAHYDLWRGLHIIMVIAWMAGIMYLPRLYAYHVKHGAGSELGRVFEGMERKLLRIIMSPAMVLTWAFGSLLIWANYENRGPEVFQQPWFLTKFAGILFVTWWHHVLSSARKKIADGTDRRSEKFWRATNELPFLAAIVMVIAVTTEFGG
jgi:protoporphyrinogen IX oxidase